MMRESQLINSWIREGEDLGRLEMKRDDLLTLVQRLEDPVPESIRLAIEGTTDLDKLKALVRRRTRRQDHCGSATIDAARILSPTHKPGKLL